MSPERRGTEAGMSHLMKRLSQHASYLRTRREIADMPWEVAHDLDIDRTKAGDYAARAVYGR
jgi:hypothetical protein